MAKESEDDQRGPGRSGKGDQEDRFEGGCLVSSRMEKWSASNCKSTGVNPAIAKGTILDKK